MKVFSSIVIFIILTNSALAKMNKIKPKNVTCAFLQNKLYHEEALYIKDTRLGGLVQIKDIAYSEGAIDERCPRRDSFGDRFVKKKAIVKTKDVEECNIGFYCRNMSPSW